MFPWPHFDNIFFILYLESSIITDTELSYLEGATSPIQAQINNKQETLISKGNSTGNLFTDSKFIEGLQAGQNITLGQNINFDDPDEKNIIINADLSNVQTTLASNSTVDVEAFCS